MANLLLALWFIYITQIVAVGMQQMLTCFNQRRRYAHARLFGYVKTNKDGKFELHTIKPSGYPQSDPPAHIHVHIDANGYRSIVTEFLFDDDDRLVSKIRENSIRNNFMISKPEKTESPFAQKFSYSITLQK
jgi:protocatechuate 3,4-dioxygenase beta subunit